MQFWRNLLGGLLLWAAHFVAVYAVASIWPGSQLARALVAAATVLALALGGWLSVKAMRRFRAATDDLHRWSWSLTLLGYALAGVAIAYQGLPSALS